MPEESGVVKAFFVANIGTVAQPLAQPSMSYTWRPGATDAEAALGKGMPTAENLVNFCYPMGAGVVAKEYMASEGYSFTLTAGDGSHQHGFCRRFLPPKSSNSSGSPSAMTRPASSKSLESLSHSGSTGAFLRLPVVACIITNYVWCDFMHKVLEVIEELFLATGLQVGPGAPGTLPLTHPVAQFLNNLLQQLPTSVVLGHVVRVRLPDMFPAHVALAPMAGLEEFGDVAHIGGSNRYIDLLTPPQYDGSFEGAGVPLGQLLWHIQPEGLASLLAALLLERRVIIAARDLDRLTRAVHAAAALLYPFKWHHIFLPLLPTNLLDYLTSPIPYLIGLPAECLRLLDNLPLEEVTIIDLDLQRVDPQAGSPSDDGVLLPYRKRLMESVEMLRGNLKSPTELESTPVITSLLQEYFLKLIGSYRETIFPESALADAGGTSQNGQDEDVVRAHGMAFEVDLFIARQRSERHRNFLKLFRHSQMFQLWMEERLKLAAGGYVTDDTFEAKVAALGPGGRRVAQPVRALSKKLPKGVTQAATKSVYAVNTVLAKGSHLKESLGKQIKDANFKGRAHQTFKALKADLQPKLAAQLQRLSSGRPNSGESDCHRDSHKPQTLMHSSSSAADLYRVRPSVGNAEPSGGGPGGPPRGPMTRIASAPPVKSTNSPVAPMPGAFSEPSAGGGPARPPPRAPQGPAAALPSLIDLSDEEDWFEGAEDDDGAPGDPEGALYRKRLQEARDVQQTRTRSQSVMASISRGPSRAPSQGPGSYQSPGLFDLLTGEPLSPRSPPTQGSTGSPWGPAGPSTWDAFGTPAAAAAAGVAAASNADPWSAPSAVATQSATVDAATLWATWDSPKAPTAQSAQGSLPSTFSNIPDAARTSITAGNAAGTVIPQQNGANNATHLPSSASAGMAGAPTDDPWVALPLHNSASAQGPLGPGPGPLEPLASGNKLHVNGSAAPGGPFSGPVQESGDGHQEVLQSMEDSWTGSLKGSQDGSPRRTDRQIEGQRSVHSRRNTSDSLSGVPPWATGQDSLI